MELVPTAALTSLLFEEACLSWLESRRPYISPKTFHEYDLNIRTLGRYFGAFRLQEIDGDMVRTYQRDRMKKCGAFSINHECGVLRLVRKRIGMPLEDYQPLPLPKEERGQAMSDEQKARLLRMAQANPNWLAAYCFAMISVNTTAGPKETYTLRLKDVDVDRRSLRVQPGGAKNVHRIRRIPLNDEALLGVNLALQRARSLGATDPDHYLFPFRVDKGNCYDPTRHQVTFKTAWMKLRAAAGLPTFRMYDLRHHAISVMLEDPDVSEQTAEELAGHISRRMKKRYSHLRDEAARNAVDALIRKKTRTQASKADGDQSNQLAQELLNVLLKLLKK